MFPLTRSESRPVSLSTCRVCSEVSPGVPFPTRGRDEDELSTRSVATLVRRRTGTDTRVQEGPVPRDVTGDRRSPGDLRQQVDKDGPVDPTKWGTV